jgi:hypothetical protein
MRGGICISTSFTVRIAGRIALHKEPVETGFNCYYKWIATRSAGIEGAELRFLWIARESPFPRMPLRHSEGPGIVFGGFKERQ